MWWWNRRRVLTRSLGTQGGSSVDQRRGLRVGITAVMLVTAAMFVTPVMFVVRCRMHGTSRVARHVGLPDGTGDPNLAVDAPFGSCPRLSLSFGVSASTGGDMLPGRTTE